MPGYIIGQFKIGGPGRYSTTRPSGPYLAKAKIVIIPVG